MNVINWTAFIAGLGLFLFGVNLMSDGLKSFAGDKLRDIIEKFTSTPVKGILIGALITALVQSSTATTTIVIGFVRSGLMTLEQAAGTIIGANIGTTITSFLIGLNISSYAVYMIFAGAVVIKFTKKKKYHDLGDVLVGFGCLFYGLSMVSGSLANLKELEAFQVFANACTQNPFIGLIGGIVMTFAMQSSAAAIGVIQIIYETGAIGFAAVIPFLYGSNIGTCIAAIIASMGGNVSSRRAGMLHLTFNMIGTIIGMIALVPLGKFMSYISTTFSIQPMMQIAIVHIIFNLATTIILTPFIKYLCMFTRWIVKGEEPKKREIDIDQLNPKNMPVAATAQMVAFNSILDLKNLVKENVEEVQAYLSKPGNSDDFDSIVNTEGLIDKLDHSITKFITSINVDQLSEAGAHLNNLYLDLSKNLERMGDLVTNVAEFGKMITEDKGSFSPQAIEELNVMFSCYFEMLENSFSFVSEKDVEMFAKVMSTEEVMDYSELSARENHFARMASGECTSAVAAGVYLDILSNLERMGDHCCNIVKSVYEQTNFESTL